MYLSHRKRLVQEIGRNFRKTMLHRGYTGAIPKTIRQGTRSTYPSLEIDSFFFNYDGSLLDIGMYGTDVLTKNSHE